jgi:hypothetical protein
VLVYLVIQKTTTIVSLAVRTITSSTQIRGCDIICRKLRLTISSTSLLCSTVRSTIVIIEFIQETSRAMKKPRTDSVCKLPLDSKQQRETIIHHYNVILDGARCYKLNSHRLRKFCPVVSCATQQPGRERAAAPSLISWAPQRWATDYVANFSSIVDSKTQAPFGRPAPPHQYHGLVRTHVNLLHLDHRRHDARKFTHRIETLKWADGRRQLLYLVFASQSGLIH